MYFFFFKKKILTLAFFYLFPIISFALENDKSCENISAALEVNTGAYNKCLYLKSGEKFSQDEISKCKSYYLSQIERLSYVYKNICKNN